MIKIFAVFDLKGGAFGMPVFQTTRGLALRGFADACANPESPMAQHPLDYSLFELGEYDPNTGKITSLPAPEPLVTAAAVIQQLIESRRQLPSVDPKPLVEKSAKVAK